MIRYVPVLVLSVFAFGAWAQTSLPQHTHPNVTVVDGAIRPELIPDTTAYRLWLTSVSLPPNATDKQRHFQQGHLTKVQLSSADYQELLSVLTDFRTHYLALIAIYNKSAKAALLNGGQADLKGFLQQLDDLVSSTRDAITQRLSQEGAARIEAHVQGEKSHIQLHTTGGPQ